MQPHWPITSHDFEILCAADRPLTPPTASTAKTCSKCRRKHDNTGTYLCSTYRDRLAEVLGLRLALVSKHFIAISRIGFPIIMVISGRSASTCMLPLWPLGCRNIYDFWDFSLRTHHPKIRSAPPTSRHRLRCLPFHLLIIVCYCTAVFGP